MNALAEAPPSADLTLAFKSAMRNLAGAITVVTVGDERERTGMTVTSVTSFSMEPPAIVVSMNQASSSWHLLQRRGWFGVNALRESQTFVADSFSGRSGRSGAQRYDGIDWHPLPSGTPALRGALLSLDCEVDAVFQRHSHALVIGFVRSVEVGPHSDPLAYWNGRYVGLAELPR